MLAFFPLAVLAACAFALTWLLLLYAAAAGTVFVGGRVLATTLRLQDGQQRRPRIYRER